MFSSARQAISAKSAPTMKTRWVRSSLPRASRPDPTAICLPLPTGWAAWIWARLPRPPPSQSLTEEFAKAQAGTMLISLLPRLIQHANAAVHDCTLAPEYRGKNMATTLVACALRHDQAIVSHVGDSRCYLVRNGQARQITQDHTWSTSRERWASSPPAKLPTPTPATCSFAPWARRCLSRRTPLPSPCRPGDVLVLCTDGLHDEMSEEDHRRDRLAEEEHRGDRPRTGGPRRRDRRRRQYHRAGHSRPLGGAGGHVPRPALPAALLMATDLEPRKSEGCEMTSVLAALTDSLLFLSIFPIELEEVP